MLWVARVVSSGKACGLDRWHFRPSTLLANSLPRLKVSRKYHRVFWSYIPKPMEEAGRVPLPLRRCIPRPPGGLRTYVEARDLVGQTQPNNAQGLD